ncbi:hypothetical protein JCM9279_000253 [Rhodotorula babjevae]
MQQPWRAPTTASYPDPRQLHSPPLAVETTSLRSSPLLRRDDGSTWRLVERVTEVFIVDSRPRTPSPPPPPPGPPPARPPRPEAGDDPNRTPRRPYAASGARARAPSPLRTPSPSPTRPQRLAALTDTLHALDAAELDRYRLRAISSPALPLPQRRSFEPFRASVLAAQDRPGSGFNFELERHGALFAEGAPFALGLGSGVSEGREVHPSLRSAWSSTTEEDEGEVNDVESTWSGSSFMKHCGCDDDGDCDCDAARRWSRAPYH